MLKVIITVHLFVTLLLSSAALADRRVGNGGGGLTVDGNYLTFPETGAKIEGRRLLQIPELTHLSQVLSKLEISPNIFQTLMPSLYPSFKRSYYEVTSVDPMAMEQIRKIYSQLFKIAPEKVVVYAVTDADTQKTFLLPDFFKLNDLQKSVVLFHEWIWAANAEVTYEDVLVGDQLFWSFQQDPTQYYELSLYLAQMFKNPDILLGPIFSRSSDIGAELLTPDFENCLALIPEDDSPESSELAQVCLDRKIQAFASLSEPTNMQKMLWQYSLMGERIEYSRSSLKSPKFFSLHASFVSWSDPTISYLDILDEKNEDYARIYFRKK